MELISKQDPDQVNPERKKEVLIDCEPLIKKLMDRHVRNQKLWFSNDFLPASERDDEDAERSLFALRERARDIPVNVRVGLALNLLTEEGLPHFHRLLSNYLGENNSLVRWNYLWTAEEDRHGNVLRDYARDARLFNFRELDIMQYEYMKAGFDPQWNRDPYKLFVYTSLQERATQFSHKNLGSVVGENEPLLKGILEHIAVDEAKHYLFYRSVFQGILETDPNGALLSAAAIMPGIDMPGMNMPGFKEMADVAYQTGIYGPEDYRSIVIELIEKWQISSLSGLNADAEKARDKIMNIPARLERLSQLLRKRISNKKFSFGFVPGKA